MKEQAIIIIAAKQMDIDECATLIHDDFPAIYFCTNIPEVRELLKEHESSTLIFNHESLKQSFNFYQNLFHNKKKAQDSQITTVLLCKAADVDSAHKLVTQNIFDDYVIYRPLYDPHRLSLTLHSMSNAHSITASQKELEKQLADLTEQSINKHFQQTEDSLKQAAQQWGDDVKDEVASDVQQLDEVAEGYDAAGKKILIVDEDEIYSCTLQSILEEIGFSVACESGGVKGLKRMAMMQPDHVLMDYDLPDMTGIDFLKRAKGSNLLQHIPVILLTAHTERDIVKKSICSGAKGYIVKPTNREAILVHLRDTTSSSVAGNG